MPGSAAVHEQQFYARYIGATLPLLTVSGAPALSGALSFGARYALRCAETPIYLRQGGAGLSVTASDLLLRDGDLLEVNVDDLTNNRISVITASGLGGKLRITRIDSLSGAGIGSPAVHKAMYFAQYIGTTVQATVGNVVQVASLLSGAQIGTAARFLLLCPDDDCYLRQGDPGVTVTDQDFLLPAGEEFEINVDDANSYKLAVLSATGIGGTLRATRIDAV